MLKGKIIFRFVVVSFLLVFAFNNCTKDADFDNSDSSSASSFAADYLLGLIDDAVETEAQLREQGTPEAIAQANEIRLYIDMIEQLIAVDGRGLSIGSAQVLDARDYLLNAHLMGRDMLIEYNFNAAIAALQAEDERLSNLIAELEIKFDASLADLETRLRTEMQASDAEILAQLNALRDRFNAFETQVNNKFIEVDGRLVNLETITTNLQTRIDEIDANIVIIQNNITNIQDSSESAMKALWEALEGVKKDLMNEIVAVKEAQNEMKEKLAEQQKAFESYVADQSKLAEVQGRMCKLDASGELSVGQTACDGSSTEDDVLDGSCCMTADNLDCDMMFPDETDSAKLAKTQCNSFIVTLRNRDAQIKELAEADAEQKKDIELLMARVDDLEEVVKNLSEEVKGLVADMESLKSKLADIDDRLLIVEFKASRAEAGATLNEMSDLYLAWITRRKADVRNRFCHHNAKVAYNRSDYEVAKQNHVYCHERLAWLNQAQELVQLAKAYTNGVLSTNVDQNCSANISGRNAESLSVNDLSDMNVAQEVIKKCTSGQALTKAYLLSIIKLHNKIGPDFRTAEYMAKKAKIAQLLYFGSEVHLASSAAIQAFENVDPTADHLKDTPYGKIERVFKRRYVETRLRVSGKYPEDPSQFKANISGFNVVYTHAEINGAADAYLKRVKALEIEGTCGGQCGFKVVGRNKVARIGSRYSYPQDSKTKCPIFNDIVMIPSQDGKHYAYRLNYSRYQGATEQILPYWTWNSNHHPIAESAADVAAGKFRQCGYRVRNTVHRFGIPDTKLRGRLALRYGKPYAKTHGLPQCMRFHFTCRLWDGPDGNGEWVSPNPNANIMHYLSGYSNAKVDSFCKTSGASYVPKTRQLSQDEKATMHYYKGVQDAGSIAMANAVNSNTTQLTEDYWMTRDVAVAYGSGNKTTSVATPFYGKSSSHGQAFFRKLFKMTDFANIDVQQCYDPQ